MPWDCKACELTVEVDQDPCPQCGITKEQWTLQPDATRTFMVSRKKSLKVCVGEGAEAVESYEGATFAPANSAAALDRISLHAIQTRGLCPAPAHLLLVSGPANAESVTVSVLFETMEATDQEVALEPSADGGRAEARLAFVWGGALGDAALDGVTLIDVADGEAGTCAPSVELALGRKRPTTVSLRPLGSLRVRLEDPDPNTTETLRLTASTGASREVVPDERDDMLEAIFEALDTEATYSLEIRSGDGDYEPVFRNVSYAALRGDEEHDWEAVDDDDDDVDPDDTGEEDQETEPRPGAGAEDEDDDGILGAWAVADHQPAGVAGAATSE